MYYLGNVSKELQNASSAVIELLQYLFWLQANFYALKPAVLGNLRT